MFFGEVNHTKIKKIPFALMNQVQKLLEVEMGSMSLQQLLRHLF